MNGTTPIRVMNVITGLDRGGAETVLAQLVGALDPAQIAASVVSVTTEGPLAEPIRAAGIPLTALGMRGLSDLPSALTRLRRLIGDERPHMLQGWLYHGDLLATLACLGSSSPALAWNLRCSDIDMRHYGISSRLVRRACAFLSGRPALVIANSQAGLDVQLRLGHRPHRTALVPNGIDLKRFHPDAAARQAARAAWNAQDDTLIIGMVARWDPQKDHETFVRAAALLAGRRKKIAFVLIGKGLQPAAPGIASLLDRFPVAAPVHLLGERPDVAALIPGFDVATLSSAFGEGLPNAIAEAMACALPCVVTAIGDSAGLVGETCLTVPPRQPTLLAEAWERLVDAGPARRAALGQAALKRIVTNYRLEAMAAHYTSLWQNLARSPR